jgi:hypothetical protein
MSTRLETAAVQAFNDAKRWHEFVQEHRQSISRAEREHPGTVDRLLCLVASGTTSGMEPPAVDDAWGEQQTLFDNSEVYR